MNLSCSGVSTNHWTLLFCARNKTQKILSGGAGGGMWHEAAAVLKSKNCLVLMQFPLLKGVFPGLKFSVFN